MAYFWYPDTVSNILRAFAGWGIRLYGSASGAIGLVPPANAGSTDYTLPGSPPASDGQALICTAGGTMSWSGPYAAIAGATMTGPLIDSANGAVSTPAASFTGTPFAGGTGTTTVPLLYVNSGAAPSNWNTNGTLLGFNSPSGFSGNYIDCHNNGGSSVFVVDRAGSVTSQGTMTCFGRAVFSSTAAASAAAVTLNGTLFTGGTATTTVPYFYVNMGAAPTSYDTNGTIIGVNAPNGFNGKLLDLRNNGSGSFFNVDWAGNVLSNASMIIGANNGYSWSSRSQVKSPADGVISLINNGANSFTRLNFGGTTSSFAALQSSGTTLTVGTADGGTSAGSFSVSGTTTLSGSGAASAPGVLVNGTLFTGGSGTTTYPLFYINSGTAPTTFSTNGTVFGLNAPSGFTGNLIDCYVNGGSSVFSLNSGGISSAALAVSGLIQLGGSSNLTWNGRSRINSPADGQLTMTNGALTSFTRLNLGGTTSSFVALQSSGTTLTIGTADGGTSAGSLQISGNLIVTTQTPASSGATGTAGTIAWDSSFLYVCVATNTWKRAALSTW